MKETNVLILYEPVLRLHHVHISLFKDVLSRNCFFKWHSPQMASEMGEKIKILQNDIEILRSKVNSKDRYSSLCFVLYLWDSWSTDANYDVVFFARIKFHFTCCNCHFHFYCGEIYFSPSTLLNSDRFKTNNLIFLLMRSIDYCKSLT